MKLKLVFEAIVLSFLVSPTACHYSVSATITIKNNTERHIDSALVFIQNYKFTVRNVEPYRTYKTLVLKDSVQLNHHDMMIRVYLYDKAKSEFTGGTYCTDLSGSLNDTYMLTIGKNLNTVIMAK